MGGWGKRIVVCILAFGKMAMMAQDIIPNMSMFIDLLHKKKEFMKSIVLYGKLREGANGANEYCTE